MALSGIFLSGFSVYAMWVPLTTQQLLEQTKTIFVGNITYVVPVDVQYQSQWSKNGTLKQNVGPETMTLDQYTVHVEEFLEKPQNYNTIKIRQATVGGVPTGPSTIAGFKVGDRVVFFLPKYENQTHFPMQYLPESFAIPQYCNGHDVLAQKRIIGSNNFTVTQGGIKADYNNFTVNKPIKFLYEKDMNTLFGKSFDVKVGIAKVTDQGYPLVFSQEIHVGSKPCQWVTSASWEFTPKEQGKYTMTIMTKEDNDTGGGMSQTPFYVKFDTGALSHTSPLEQFKSGMSVQDIRCNDDLQLVIKAEDRSPVCVNQYVALRLAQIGWAVSNGSETRQLPDPTSALKLNLSVSPDIIHPKEFVTIKISVNNTYNNPIYVESQNKWAYGNLDSPCQKIRLGVAILDGYYTTRNMTEGKSLQLFNKYDCLSSNLEAGKVYEFEAQSYQVNEIMCYRYFGEPCHSEGLDMNYGFDGYWDKNNTEQPFRAGTYTVIGADEWGHVAIQYFTVTNSTGD